MVGEGVVRNLLVVFGVKVKNLYQAERLQDGINSIEQGLTSLNSMAIKASAGLAALGVGLVSVTKPVADAAAETDRFAKAFGISVEKMQGLGFAMQALGADADDISDILLQISEKANQVALGNKEATKSFQDLGISASELKGMAPVTLMERMLEGLRNVTDEQRKFALASTLLGEDLSKKFLPVMTQGGATLDSYAQIARDAGAIMDESQVQMGKRVSMTYKQLGAVVQALKTRLGLGLLPYIDRIGQQTWNWYQANRQLINQKIDEYAQKIGDRLEWVKNTTTQIGRLIDRFGGLEKIVIRLTYLFGAAMGIKALTGVISILSGVATVFAGVTLKIAGAILSVVAMLAIFAIALGLITEDFMGAERGADSFYGTLEKNFDDLPWGFKAMYILLKVLKGLFDGLRQWVAWVGEEFSVWIDLLRPFIPWIINGLIMWGAGLIAFVVAPLVVVISAFVLLLKVIRWVFGIGKAVLGAFKDALYAIIEEVIDPLLEKLGMVREAFSKGIVSTAKVIVKGGEQVADSWSRGVNPDETAGGLIPAPALANRRPTGQAQMNAAAQAMATRPTGQRATGMKNVTVSTGDTIINVNGAGDPNAVANKVSAKQVLSWDHVLNTATNTAGGL